MARTKELDMLNGALLPKLMMFSLPLALTGILQLLFNAADVIVVGKFAGSTSLAAVGATSALINLLTGAFIGISVGVNILVARYIGCRDDAGVSRAVHSAITLSLLLGVVTFLLGFFLSTPMLELMGTPDDVLRLASLYLRIYFIGIPGALIYNFAAAILRAYGDTKRPLAYLTAAGILNVILNLFFVIVCKMAADGVALASVLSQYLSAVLILIHMVRLQDSCRVEGKRLRLHGGEAGRILGLGIPAGIQHMIFAVANLFIQVGINSFDSTVVSGNSAAVNVDNVIYNVMAAFYTACSTFMGQNFGAGRHDRVMKSYFVSLTYSFAAAAVAGVLLRVFGREFLLLFTNEQAVVDAGMQKVSVMWWSFAISAFMDCTIAASRGLGKSFAPTVIVIMGSCVFRVAWVYTVFEHFHTIPSLYLLYSCSWTITAVAEIVYFVIVCRRLRGGKTAEVQSA